MDKRHAKAVQAALAAQGGMIYPGKVLEVERFLEQPKPPRKVGKFTHVIDGKTRTYQQLYNEKNRAGFKNLSVMDYCKMLSRLEMDELI